jgi:hypothetical protein
MRRAPKSSTHQSEQRIVVGVSGHRFLADPPRLIAAVDRAVSRIETVFSLPLTVLSSLAEGADRLVAKRILLRPDAALIAVLPLPEEEYLKDFEADDSRQEFHTLLQCAAEVVSMDRKSSREESYEAAGDYVIENSDVLIVVWDGQVELGRGGTGQVVSSARARKMPIAWVHAGNRNPGTTEPTSLGAEQGNLTFENF